MLTPHDYRKGGNYFEKKTLLIPDDYLRPKWPDVSWLGDQITIIRNDPIHNKILLGEPVLYLKGNLVFIKGKISYL